MPNPRKSLTGKTFGHLVVTGYAGQIKPGGNSQWECQCQCGKTTIVPYQHLTTGRTKSCGCMLGKWPRSKRTLRPDRQPRNTPDQP
jgi:hypothetical protein